MLMDAVRANRRPSQIITRKSIENTIASVAASGGSTNAVLHLLAIAREMGIELSIDDFDAISKNARRSSAILTPAGKYVASDYQAAGGSRLLAKRMIDAGHADGSTLTISGTTLAEEAALAEETPGQVVIHTFEEPIKPTGGLVILKGNLAPEGCVMKIAAADRYEHRGPARVFDSEEDCFAAVQGGRIKPGDVLVIRYEGPKGGPGMREMLQVTAAISGRSGTERARSAAHRRTIQRRDARIHRRPRGAGSFCRRPDRRGARGRHHRLRHQEPHAECGDQRGRDGGAAEGFQAAGAALAEGRVSQVCRSGDERIARGNDVESSSGQ